MIITIITINTWVFLNRFTYIRANLKSRSNYGIYGNTPVVICSYSDYLVGFNRITREIEQSDRTNDIILLYHMEKSRTSRTFTQNGKVNLLFLLIGNGKIGLGVKCNVLNSIILLSKHGKSRHRGINYELRVMNTINLLSSRRWVSAAPIKDNTLGGFFYG